MMLLDNDQLRTFLAVAETGSFTKAAEDVHRTQSAVSMQIKKLEERIGKPLFSRTGRDVRLTSEGQTLVTYAQKMMAINEAAVCAISGKEMSGSVRIGLPDDYADRLLPRVLAAFNRTHPLVEVFVECHNSGHVAAQVRNGAIDLGIVTYGDQGGTIVRREQLHWVASESMTAACQNPIPLALGGELCSWRHAATDALNRIKRNWRITYTSSSAAAINGAVAAGLAISVLPESAIRSDVRVLTQADGFPPLPVCEIGMIRAKHATHAVHNALAEHIERRLNNLMPTEQVA
ncbi:MAG: LysR substrate-binding domain-containing protein [Tepidamorphaceae bacterium]|nr:LysR family transcriptional regulator [Rhodobiaceae bacterium]MCC0048981.1 LysR family transcriptional regulator [Rhodobiaceae bacterium]